MEHTPTPWKFARGWLLGADDARVAEFFSHPSFDDQQFITSAVNSHDDLIAVAVRLNAEKDELVAGLTAALAAIELLGEELNGSDMVTEEVEGAVNPKIAIARAALAKGTA